MLEVVLDACPDVFKADERGSAVPFARELCAYLAHCRAEGGLALAVRLEGSPFKSFYRVLNAQLVAAEREAERDMQRSGSDAPDESDSADNRSEGSDAGAGPGVLDSDEEEEGHIGTASRFRFATSAW